MYFTKGQSSSQSIIGVLLPMDETSLTVLPYMQKERWLLTILFYMKIITTVLFLQFKYMVGEKLCSVHLNLPIACQSTVHHQALNMVNYQEVDLQLVWLICLLATQHKEKEMLVNDPKRLLKQKRRTRFSLSIVWFYSVCSFKMANTIR